MVSEMRTMGDAAARDLLRLAMYARETGVRLEWLAEYAESGKLPRVTGNGKPPRGTSALEAALTAWNVNYTLSLVTPEHAFRPMLERVHARWRMDAGLPLSLAQFCVLAGRSDSLVRWWIKTEKLKAYRDDDHGLRPAAGRPPGVWIKAADARAWLDAAR